MSNKYLRAMRNTITVSPEKTPFCGTCHKAGLSREEYTSHFTRESKDPNSVIVCPLILKSICSRCQKAGHWRKYCPNLMVSANCIIEEEPLFLEEYRNSDEVLFRPSSPDLPPPWSEDEFHDTKPKIKKTSSWAEIVSNNK